MVSAASSPAVPRVIWQCRARACRLTLASASPAMRKIAVSAAADSGGTGPISTRTCRPLAVANWLARVRSASARPRSSRIAGRRSSTMRRTSAMAVRRAGLAALQQPRQQPGGAGLPDDDVDRAALAADPGAAVGQVQVPDVEREDLGRPCSGLVQLRDPDARDDDEEDFDEDDSPWSRRRSRRLLERPVDDAAADAGSAANRGFSFQCRSTPGRRGRRGQPLRGEPEPAQPLIVRSVGHRLAGEPRCQP